MDLDRPANPEAPKGRFPWRPRSNDVLRIIAFFALIRVVMIVVGMFAWGHQLARSNWRGVDLPSGIRYALVPNQPFLDMWTRWDSWEYEEIARKGYWYDFNFQPRPYGTVACFPLYPLLIRGLGTLLGGRYVVAGLLISNLAAIVGFVLLFQWANWWGDRRAAWLAVWAAMAFPVGLFWSALYPQSLFFVLAVGSLTLMLDGRIAAACGLTALATATRLEAVALIPALLAIRLSQGGWRPVRSDLWFVVTPLGLFSYMAYLQATWGDPVLFLRVHQLFGRGMTNPISTLIDPIRQGTGGQDAPIAGTYFVLVLLALGHLTRVRWPILVFGWILFLIPLASGSYISIYRVHLVNVPIYLIIGLGLRGRWRFLGWFLVAFGLIFEAWTMFLWVMGFLIP